MQQSGIKRKNSDVQPDDSTSLSSEMTLLQANCYKDSDLIKKLEILDASPEAEMLGFTDKTELDTVFCKVLERKLEVLQWELFKHAEVGSNLVVLNIADKKNFVRVKVPCGDICLPFAGQVSRANGKGAIFFCKVFGMSFYVQPRSEGMNSDVVIPAWSSKPVSKACDSFFVQKKREYQICLELPHGHKPEGICFHFAESKEAQEALEAKCNQAGSTFCFLTFGAGCLINEQTNDIFINAKMKTELKNTYIFGCIHYIYI